jgi:hypothetical protein
MTAIPGGVCQTTASSGAAPKSVSTGARHRLWRIGLAGSVLNFTTAGLDSQRYARPFDECIGDLAPFEFFGLSLIPIGLAHLLYPKETAALIPTWIVYSHFWSAFTGVGQILCGLVALLPRFARIAAGIEVAMVGAFTLLVWGTAVVATPRSRVAWTAFWFSWIFAASATVIATHIETTRISKTIA